MTLRNLSKRQKALYKIAEAYGTARDKRNRQQEGLTEFGLCKAMRRLGIHKKYYGKLCYAINSEIGDAYLCRTQGSYAWTPFCDTWRSTLASFLADMTDEEYNRTFGVKS